MKIIFVEDDHELNMDAFFKMTDNNEDLFFICKASPSVSVYTYQPKSLLISSTQIHKALGSLFTKCA